jgi:hypothetical protein
MSTRRAAGTAREGFDTLLHARKALGQVPQHQGYRLALLRAQRPGLLLHGRMGIGAPVFHDH